MMRDFDHVRTAFAASWIGGIFASWSGAVTKAWRSSSTAAMAQSLAGRAAAMPMARLIRNMTVAIATAALMQPLLIAIMPRTVAPALPWPLFAMLAVFAAAIAWHAEAFANAWPSSRVARWMRG
jgi:hypothetical protein